MGSYFSKDRNVELSALKYVEDQIDASWTGIETVKTFKQVYATGTELPVVCVRLADTENVRLEIGSNTLEERYLLIVDIFARSDAQRLDLAAYIKDKLKDGWVHYDHSHVSGDKSSLSLSANGREYVTDWTTDARIDVGDTTDEKDKYRHNLSVRVRTSAT